MPSISFSRGEKYYDLDMRLFQFSRTKACYYCGEKTSITKEHVPPKVLFVNYECDKITVPACSNHNLLKSEEDEKILLGLAMIVEAGLIDFPHDRILNETVILEMARLKENFGKAHPIASRTTVWEKPKSHSPSEATRFSSDAIESWVRKITAGLVWSVTGQYDPSIKWDEAMVFCPFYYPFLPYEEEDLSIASLALLQKKRELDNLIWSAGWSHHQRAYPTEIYRFEVAFGEGPLFPGANLVFRHIFYNGCAEWFVGMHVSDQVLLAVAKGTKEIKPQMAATKKRPDVSDGFREIIRIEKYAEHHGWSRLSPKVVERIKERIGDDFPVLTELGEKYDLFNQRYFSEQTIPLSISERVMGLGNLLCSLGNQIAEQGNLGDAEIAFRISIKLNPEWPFAHTSLATLFLLCGEVDKAVVHAEEALQLYSRSTLFQGPEFQNQILQLKEILHMGLQ